MNNVTQDRLVARARIEQREIEQIEQERKDQRKTLVAELAALEQRKAAELPPLREAVTEAIRLRDAAGKAFNEAQQAVQSAVAAKSALSWELSRSVDRCTSQLEGQLLDDRIAEALADLEKQSILLQNKNDETKHEAFSRWTEWHQGTGRPSLKALAFEIKADLGQAIQAILDSAPRV